MNALLEQFNQFTKANQKTDPQFANMSHFGDFAGMKISLLNTLRSDCLNKSIWIIDTGATSHMYLSLMKKLKPVNKYTPIFLLDGSMKPVTHIGLIEFNSKFNLKDVLHVPDFKCNLLSVKCLATTTKIVFKFYSTHCVLQDLETSEIVAQGKILGNLYVLDNNSMIDHLYEKCHQNENKESCNAASNPNSSNFSIWHQRLGHSSSSVLQHLKFIHAKENEVRFPFPNSESHAKEIFELIHVDLWGPYKVKTITEASYFLTIVDDHSRSIWTFLLHDKTQVFKTLSDFFAYTSNHFKTQIKTIRTDNGSEFVNHKCNNLFSSLGIIHQRTVHYSPQQNGRVERKHQQLLQKARSLLFLSGLSIKFWGHAILMATYETPYKYLYKKDPSYSNLKVFGCLCFATNVTPHKTKLESRAAMCCFIGNNQGQKAYKLYDLNEKKNIMSRDVVFYETLFPFKNNIDHLLAEVPIVQHMNDEDSTSHY
ncbi:hypothetical protein LXL04_037557 [Taraxacum kok-saghyz]